MCKKDHYKLWWTNVGGWVRLHDYYWQHGDGSEQVGDTVVAAGITSFIKF